MKNPSLTLSLPLLMGLVACSSQTDYRKIDTPPATVSEVDLNRYAGRWYEIARYPNSFQKNCEAVTAEYSLRADGNINVTNTCHAGEVRSATAIARIVEDTGNAQLKVKFAPKWVPFAWGDYWILHLEEDYSAALVGSPDGKYLWILSRTPKLDDKIYQSITKRAKELGYATTPLKMTEHPN